MLQVEISFNKDKNGIELLFSEKLTAEVSGHLKELGFKYTFKQPLKWYAPQHPAYVKFAHDLKEALLKGAPFDSVLIAPSYTASEENIDHNKFSYVTISFLKDEVEEQESYVLFDSYKKVATEIATRYGKDKYGNAFKEVDIYPRNYKRKARTLLKEGKVIAALVKPEIDASPSINTGDETKAISKKVQKNQLEAIYISVHANDAGYADIEKSEQFTSWKDANDYLKRLKEGNVDYAHYIVEWKGGGRRIRGQMDLVLLSFDNLNDYLVDFHGSIAKGENKIFNSADDIEISKYILEHYEFEDPKESTKKPEVLSKKEKLEILADFGKFAKKRQSEFGDLIIEEELFILFSSWLRVNHPKLLPQKDSIWHEYYTIQNILDPDPEKPQIPPKDHYLFFRKFVEQGKSKQVGESLTMEGLAEFSAWLEENYPDLSEVDKKALKAGYKKNVESVERTRKRLKNLETKTKKPQPFSAIYNKLLKVAPNLIPNLQKGFTHGKSESSGFMDLNLDFLYQDEDERFVIALSHYYKQNGDLIADPDMQIRIDPKMEVAEALTYQDSFGFKQVYIEEDSKVMVNTRQKKDLNKFLSFWLTNILNQKHKIVWDIPKEYASSYSSRRKEIDRRFSQAIRELSKDKIYCDLQEFESIVIHLVAALGENTSYQAQQIIIEPQHANYVEEQFQKISKPTVKDAKDVALAILDNHLTGDEEDFTFSEEDKAKTDANKNLHITLQEALQAAIWTNDDNEHPIDKIEIADNIYNQSRLRKILLDELGAWPIEFQLSLVNSLSQKFNERRPYKKNYVHQGFKGEKAEKASIRSYVDDIIIDNDLTDRPAGVLEYLIENLFGQSKQDPLTNNSGVYAADIPGSKVETIKVDLPKSSKISVKIDIAQGSDGLFRFGQNVNKNFGDYSSGGYAPSVSSPTFATRNEAYEAALEEAFDNLNEKLITEDAILNNEEKKKKMIQMAIDALSKHRQLIVVEDSLKAQKPKKKADKISQHELNQEIEQFIQTKDKKEENYSKEDKEYIKQYAGSGGQIKKGATGKGILYEYYTDDEIVKKMWGLALKYGYDGGEILEPSVGIGNFLRYAPTERVVGYETNPTAKRIAEILYPKATIIGKPFETIFFAGNVHLKDDFGDPSYDLVIGNPPYGEFSGRYAGMGEKKWTGATEYDQYFITRGLDLLRKNGLLIFIIPSAFLTNDSKYNRLKEEIVAKAELIDAYRLPQGVFKTTDIGTDIVVFERK